LRLAKPQYQQDEDFRVVIYRPGIAADDQSEGLSQGTQSGTQAGTQSGTQAGTQLGTMSKQLMRILDFCRVPRQVGEIRGELGYTNRTKFRQTYMKPLLTATLLEMTIPEKPTSSQQKYRVTAKGLELLARNA